LFTEFYQTLRKRGVPVSLQEWLTFLEALEQGLIRENLDDFYHVGRALLVKHEARFDLYDEVFLSCFKGVPGKLEVTDDLLNWLENPKAPRPLTPEDIARIEALKMDLEALRKEFEQRLKEQNERHDGGSHWVGTGGTSPFGSGGFHPGGIRVGPQGGGFSAMQVAEKRVFKNYRHDLTLDIRGIQVALKKLRRLKRTGGEDELDVEETIEATCRDAGELNLVFRKPRKNQAKLVLMMDSGGSMAPHARLVSTLFSAAHGINHFQSFRHFYFHNCVYESLYTDIRMQEQVPTADVLRNLDDDTDLILVGDAYMHPAELTEAYGAIHYWHGNETPGINWLRRISKRFRRTIWLNPLRPALWGAPTISLIGRVFPMFPLTVEGIGDGIDELLHTGTERG